VPVALIRPGNGCVGIGALLKPYTYTLSARSKEISHLTEIPSSEMRALFANDPDFGCAVMGNLAQRLLDRLVETREEVKLHFINLIQSATFS
jgi:CRP-like cAMP-binding protein